MGAPKVSLSLSQVLLGKQKGDSSSQGTPCAAAALILGPVLWIPFRRLRSHRQPDAGRCMLPFLRPLPSEELVSLLRWVSLHRPLPVPFLESVGAQGV